MTIKTAASLPLRWGRHCLGAVRALSPAAIAVTLALVVGGTGFAAAATGGTFILGKTNYESSTARLSDSKGIPLSLSAPANVAPLAVNGRAMVPNLNANYVGGLSASDIQPTGGDGFTPPGTDTALSTTPTVVTSTGPLAAGTYYVTATAFLDASSEPAYCWIAMGSNPGAQLAFGGGSGSISEAAETVAASVSAGDTLQELCYFQVPGGSDSVNDAGITAVRILSSSGTTPATTGIRAPLPRPMRHSG